MKVPHRTHKSPPTVPILSQLHSVITTSSNFLNPLDCYKYYLRIDDSFHHLTYPNSLVFDKYKQCTMNECTIPYITPLNGSDCNQNMEGYYCESPSSFTYCTRDGLKIVDNAFCPIGLSCLRPNYTNLCVLYL
jgi:hypothetical protein